MDHITRRKLIATALTPATKGELLASAEILKQLKIQHPGATSTNQLIAQVAAKCAHIQANREIEQNCPGDPLYALNDVRRAGILSLPPTWSERVRMFQWRNHPHRRRYTSDCILYERRQQYDYARPLVEASLPPMPPLHQASPAWRKFPDPHYLNTMRLLRAARRIASEHTLANSQSARVLWKKHFMTRDQNSR